MDATVCPLVSSASIKDAQFDSVVIVTDSLDKLGGSLSPLQSVLTAYSQVVL